MKHVDLWDGTLCGSCKKRRFRGTYRFHHQRDKNERAKNVSSLLGCDVCLSVLQLLITANGPSSLILFIPMIEAIRSYQTSVLTRGI
jgi:hypothetical protein